MKMSKYKKGHETIRLGQTNFLFVEKHLRSYWQTDFFTRTVFFHAKETSISYLATHLLNLQSGGLY